MGDFIIEEKGGRGKRTGFLLSSVPWAQEEESPNPPSRKLVTGPTYENQDRKVSGSICALVMFDKTFLNKTLCDAYLYLIELKQVAN